MYAQNIKWSMIFVHALIWLRLRNALQQTKVSTVAALFALCSRVFIESAH